MSTEILEIFDEQNRSIGREGRSKIHEQGSYHRSIIVFLFNEKGEIFLQLRSKTKDICPLCWDVSVAGHLLPGEEYKNASLRELEEELGIIAILEEVRGTHLLINEYQSSQSGRLIDREFARVFKAVSSQEVSIGEYEVNKGGFFTIGEVKRKILEERESFTPWFLEEWEYLVENNLI